MVRSGRRKEEGPLLPLPESPEEQPPRPPTGQSAPPAAQPPRLGLTRWLDRHAHPESRTFCYLDLARALIQVLAIAGLLGLIVQLREANITATRRTLPGTSTR